MRETLSCVRVVSSKELGKIKKLSSGTGFIRLLQIKFSLAFKTMLAALFPNRKEIFKNLVDFPSRPPYYRHASNFLLPSDVETQFPKLGFFLLLLLLRETEAWMAGIDWRLLPPPFPPRHIGKRIDAVWFVVVAYTDVRYIARCTDRKQTKEKKWEA